MLAPAALPANSILSPCNLHSEISRKWHSSRKRHIVINVIVYFGGRFRTIKWPLNFDHHVSERGRSFIEPQMLTNIARRSNTSWRVGVVSNPIDANELPARYGNTSRRIPTFRPFRRYSTDAFMYAMPVCEGFPIERCPQTRNDESVTIGIVDLLCQSCDTELSQLFDETKQSNDAKSTFIASASDETVRKTRSAWKPSGPSNVSPMTTTNGTPGPAVNVGTPTSTPLLGVRLRQDLQTTEKSRAPWVSSSCLIIWIFLVRISWQQYQWIENRNTVL